jgi:isoleucyl-tRNA synthetase
LLAVHPDVDYVYVETEDETLILADALRTEVLRELEHKVLRKLKGSELVGLRYLPLFTYLEVDGDAFRVLPADFVTTDTGTGIVHTAPPYGVDDLALGQENGLPVIHTVGQDGHFLPEIEAVAGMFFKDADKPLIRILKDRGLMFRSEKYRHSYPFGWRTGDPIIYYAKNAWYIRTSYAPRISGIVWLNSTRRSSGCQKISGTVVLANGSKTMSTGPCHENDSGARRCRSGPMAMVITWRLDLWASLKH